MGGREGEVVHPKTPANRHKKAAGLGYFDLYNVGMEKANERLRSARLAAGLSQAEVAARAGTHQPHISVLEQTWRGSPKLRARVAETLGVSLSTAELVESSQ